MARKDIITGIDIGSSKIAITMAQLSGETIDVLGACSVPNNGVRKGIVVDLEETISALSAALEEVEKMSGQSVLDALVSVSGQHIEWSQAKGVVSVARADGDITELDIERAVESARALDSPPNRETIHSIPHSYSLDGQSGIKDPIGMTGVRLEVQAGLISASTSVIRNLNKCLNQAGVNISEYVFAPLADAKLVTTKQQRGVGALLIDMGAQTTDYAIYEEDQILTAGSVPLGSGHITNDLAIGLRTTIEMAEKIKCEHSTAMPGELKHKILDGAKFGYSGNIDLGLVADIIEARLNEIFVMVRDQLRKINRDGLLPAGAILTGGGSMQEGIISLAKETLKLPAARGELNTELSGIVDNASEPNYATSVGLVLWALEAANMNRGPLSNWMSGGVKGVVDKTKNIFRNLIP